MIKAYIVPSVKTVATLLAGALLTALLYQGWYYWQVLKWVDGIRIQQAIEQAVKQGQQKAPSP